MEKLNGGSGYGYGYGSGSGDWLKAGAEVDAP